MYVGKSIVSICFVYGICVSYMYASLPEVAAKIDAIYLGKAYVTQANFKELLQNIRQLELSGSPSDKSQITTRLDVQGARLRVYIKRFFLEAIKNPEFSTILTSLLYDVANSLVMTGAYFQTQLSSTSASSVAILLQESGAYAATNTLINKLGINQDINQFYLLMLKDAEFFSAPMSSLEREVMSSIVEIGQERGIGTLILSALKSTELPSISGCDAKDIKSASLYAEGKFQSAIRNTNTQQSLGRIIESAAQGAFLGIALYIFGLALYEKNYFSDLQNAMTRGAIQGVLSLAATAAETKQSLTAQALEHQSVVLLANAGLGLSASFLTSSVIAQIQQCAYGQLLKNKGGLRNVIEEMLTTLRFTQNKDFIMWKGWMPREVSKATKIVQEIIKK